MYNTRSRTAAANTVPKPVAESQPEREMLLNMMDTNDRKLAKQYELEDYEKELNERKKTLDEREKTLNEREKALNKHKEKPTKPQKKNKKAPLKKVKKVNKSIKQPCGTNNKPSDHYGHPWTYSGPIYYSKEYPLVRMHRATCMDCGYSWEEDLGAN